MVRYGQFSKLPCNPTPEEDNFFKEEYTKIKGIISIKTLTKTIEPLFERHLRQTAKIYSLSVDGTHADCIFRKNKLIHSKQSMAVSELQNLSNYLISKMSEFKKLENKLIESLQNEFNSLLENIKVAIEKIHKQYKKILEDRFEQLRLETSKQIRIILEKIGCLQKQFDQSVLIKRKLSEEEMTKIAGISKEEIQGYDTLFRIVSNQTLKDLQGKQLYPEINPDQQLVIDVQKIKNTTCHDLWCLIELPKIKNHKQAINHVQNPQYNSSSNQNQTDFHLKINKQEIMISLEQAIFNSQLIIINELSQKIYKNPKHSKHPSKNQSMNEAISGQETLTDLIKQKPLKKLTKSVKTKIQSEFVNFNRDFSYEKYLASIPIPQNPKQLQGQYQQNKEKTPQKSNYHRINTQEAEERNYEITNTIKQIGIQRHQNFEEHLILREESFVNQSVSLLHVKNDSFIKSYQNDENEALIQERKKQAQTQYKEYVKRMTMQQKDLQVDSSEQRDSEQKNQRQRIEKQNHDNQKQLYQAYQRELNEKDQERKLPLFDEQSSKLSRIQSDISDISSQEQMLSSQTKLGIEIERQFQIQKEIKSQIFSEKQQQTQRLKSLLDLPPNNRKSYSHYQEPKYIPQFLGKDLQSQRVLEEWKKNRRKGEEQKKKSEIQEINPINQRQNDEDDPFSNIPDFDYQEQLKIMKMYEMQNLRKKQKQYTKQQNPMISRFKNEVEKFQEQELVRPLQNQQQNFDFEDYRRQKQSQESLLNFALSQSLIDSQPQRQEYQPFKSNFESIIPIQRNLMNPFGMHIGKREPEKSFDNTLVSFEKLLHQMFQMKTSCSLTNLIYNSGQYDEDDQEFDSEDEESTERKIMPIQKDPQQKTKGHMTIKQIMNSAEQLNISKEAFSILVKVIQPVLLTFKTRDVKKNRPMTKLIVGDSTGIAILYMNYYCEVTAGNCVKLDFCRLSKHHQSFQINHHRNMTLGDIRLSNSVPSVSNDFMLSTIRKVDREKYEYDVRSNFNLRLIDCISEFKRNRIMVGEIDLLKPVIVSVCQIIKGRECIIGDYTGKIAADFSNMKRDVNINEKDTLLLRRAKLQINRGEVVMIADPTTFVIKADMEFKFYHDMKFIPNKILKAYTI